MSEKERPKTREKVAQLLVDDNAASEAILDQHRQALEKVNRCEILESEQPDTLKTLIARSKVEQTLWDICIGAAHTMNAPFLMRAIKSYCLEKRTYSLPSPTAEDYPHPSGLAEHP